MLTLCLKSVNFILMKLTYCCFQVNLLIMILLLIKAFG